MCNGTDRHVSPSLECLSQVPSHFMALTGSIRKLASYCLDNLTESTCSRRVLWRTDEQSKRHLSKVLTLRSWKRVLNEELEKLWRNMDLWRVSVRRYSLRLTHSIVAQQPKHSATLNPAPHFHSCLKASMTLRRLFAIRRWLVLAN